VTTLAIALSFEQGTAAPHIARLEGTSVDAVHVSKERDDSRHLRGLDLNDSMPDVGNPD